MGDKQLDFNAPLLSVRRFASPLRSSALNSVRGLGKGGEDPGKRFPEAMAAVVPPPYRSDFVSGPVRNSGVVPFAWEKVPGKPKDSPVVVSVSSHNSDAGSLEMPPSAPRLPPGKVVHCRNERAHTTKDEVHKFKMVNWPDHSGVVQTESSARAMVDRLENLGARSHESPLLEGDNKTKRSSEDGNDFFVISDALESLSLAELSLFNDSVSDGSGMDGHMLKICDDSASGRRFMLERFLPAAKAMALEAPQLATRKHPPGSEPGNMLLRNEDAPPHGQAPFLIEEYALEQEEGNTKDDFQDGNDNEGGEDLENSMSSVSVPWTSHMPRVRAKKQNTFSQKGVIPVNSYDGGSFSGSDELIWENVDKHKLVHSIVSSGVHTSGSKLSESASSPSVYEDTPNSHLNYCSDSQSQDGSSSYRRSTGRISPYRNQASGSPFREGAGFLGFPKSGQSFSSDGSDINTRGLDVQKGPRCKTMGTSRSSSPTIQKTAYLDSMRTVRMPYPKSIQPVTKRFTSSSDNELNSWAEVTEKQGKTVRESRDLGHKIKIHLVDENELHNSNLAKSANEHSGLLSYHRPPSSADASNPNLRGHDSSTGETHAIVKEGNPPMSPVKLLDDGAKGSDRDLSEHQSSGNRNDLTKGNSSCIPPLLPLPLPKSPSESWLSGALPVVSSQNSSSLSFLQRRTKKNVIKPSADSKWENIIKSTNNRS